jgi:exopolysaccharide biosynthesis polyprenyl glycosylphosphotransferase
VSTTREAPPSGKAVRGARQDRPKNNHGDVAILRHAPHRGRRGWLMRRLLLVADVVALLVSFGIVELTFGSAHTATDALGFHTEFALFFLSLPIWIVLAKLYSLYDRDEERADYSTGDELIGVFHLVTVGTFLFFAGSWLTGLVHPTPAKIFAFWALAIVTMTAARASARAFCRRQSAYVQDAVVVGAGDIGQLIALKLLRHPEYGINVLGFVDAMPKERREGLGDLPILGQLADLRELVEALDVDRVIIAFSNDGHDETIELIRALSEIDVRVDVVPRLFTLLGRNTGIHNVEGLPLMAVPRPTFPSSTLLIKRTTDILFSSAGLLLLAPVFLVIAAMIKLDSPGPIFFRQTRMGEGGKTFKLFKFRTMAVDAETRKADLAGLNKHAVEGDDPQLFKVPDDPRVTRFGRFLRRYSLDELPQLINVLSGEMSLVGPRPLILEEDQHVVDWRQWRLTVKPGMTGLWQVVGRDHISFEEMVELDYRYVADWSLAGDLGLLLRTLPAVARERSVY